MSTGVRRRWFSENRAWFHKVLLEFMLLNDGLWFTIPLLCDYLGKQGETRISIRTVYRYMEELCLDGRLLAIVSDWSDAYVWYDRGFIDSMEGALS